MLAPANTAREVMASHQLTARDFFVEIDYPHLGTRLTYPGGMAKTSIGGIGIRRPAPRVGEHNAEIYESLDVDGVEQAVLTEAGII